MRKRDRHLCCVEAGAAGRWGGGSRWGARTTLAHPFRGFRFPPEVILRAVRWYLRFSVSSRDLEQMLAGRGVRADHVSLHRWAQRFAPELERRARSRLRPTGSAWHVDETYIRAGGGWRYLYRAVDGAGRTVAFLPSATRDAAAARRFSRAPPGAAGLALRAWSSRIGWPVTERRWAS